MSSSRTINTNITSSRPPKAEPVTTTQVSAMYLAYKSILLVLLLPVILILVVPSLFSVTCSVFDSITDRHSVLALLISCLIGFGCWTSIERVAPSRQKAREALMKPRIHFGIILLSISVSIMLCRMLGTWFQWSSAVPLTSLWTTTARLATGSFLLGLSVVFRYVGQASTVRCSSSPVFVNKWKLDVHWFMQTFTFMSFVLDVLEKILWWRPKVVVKSQVETKKNNLSQNISPVNARRLQMPNFTSIVIQMVFCTLIAYSMAIMTVLPFSSVDIYDPNGDDTKRAVYATCIIASLIDLATSTFPISGQLHHELNPDRYDGNRLFFRRRPYYSGIVWLRDFFISGDAMMRLIVPTCLTIAVALLSRTALSDCMLLLVSAYGITLYQATFDFFLRIKLCTTPSNMRHVLKTVVGSESLEDSLTVALTTILHSNDDLVTSANRTLRDFTTSGIASEEHRHHGKDVVAMANTLRYITPADEKAPHLEDDLLRVAVLRSLRDYDRWIVKKPQSLNGGRYVNPAQEFAPYSIPLLRSLCVYVGGLGEALVMCSKDNQAWNEEWLVPPGAIQCAELALESIASCLIWNFDIARIPTVSWSSSPVAFLVGSRVLSAAFRLRMGIVEYAKSCGKLKTGVEIEPKKREIVRNHCPQLLSLYDTTNDASLRILEKLSSIDTIGSRIKVDTFAFDSDKWTQDLLVKIPALTSSY